MTADYVEALVQEVRDLLGTSSVGLYEFVWVLRGLCPDESLDIMRDQAATALRRLLATGEGRLVLLKWPSEDVVGPYEWERVQLTDWGDPNDRETYVAITRN